MALQFPEIMLFVERDGERIEISRGFVSQGEMLLIKTELRKREYEIGQQLITTTSDFENIAFACWCFGRDLAQNLPKTASA